MNYTVENSKQQVIDAEALDLTSEAIKQAVTKATDISVEMDRVISMTPKDGYQKKIDLIVNAEDLSTKEKLSAIDAAENKYAQDLAENAEVCKSVMWSKAGLTLVCVAGVVLMVSSPEGRKIVKAILKSVA